MLKLTHLTSVADAAHALALELYRFTARWPECEREGLTLEVRRTGHALSSCLACAGEGLRVRALRRAVDNARGKHARLQSLLRLASDLGYRKLSSSARVDEMMDHLYVDLDMLAGELGPGAGFESPNGRASASRTPTRRARRRKSGRQASADLPGRNGPD